MSAQGYHFAVIYNGTAHLLDGTSGSAPVFAAVVALLNDALIAEKKPPLGFLNPWLYSVRKGLRDVTHGRATGCNTTGFPATVGWDAATGLGTPVSLIMRFEGEFTDLMTVVSGVKEVGAVEKVSLGPSLVYYAVNGKFSANSIFASKLLRFVFEFMNTKIRVPFLQW